jgi:hypothetical protein
MRGAGVEALAHYYAQQDNVFPPGSMRLVCVSNHDKNAWEGTEFEQFGEGLQAATVLTMVGDGLPMLYNGQEAGNARRLAFFERDPIEWRDHPNGELYRRLILLKKRYSALWWGARMLRVGNDRPASVLSFVRQDDAGKVFALLNFSGVPQCVRFTDQLACGEYTDYFSGVATAAGAATGLELPPWGYRVLLR